MRHDDPIRVYTFLIKMLRVVLLFIALLLLFPLFPWPLGAQWICDDCHIRLDTVATLGAVEDPFSPSPSSEVAAFGPFFVVGPLDGMDDAVALYEQGAEPRILGNSGDGPGEFRGVDHVAASAERLHVFSAGRETIFNRALEVEQARHVPIGGVMEAELVQEASVILGFGGSGLGLRLLLVDSTRASVLSEWDLPPSARNLVGYRRVLGSARSGGFWMAPNNQYSFELWSSTGELLRTLVPVESWFPTTTPAPEEIIDPLEAPPPPIIAALREDDEGHLWVASYQPADDGPALKPTPEGEGPELSRARYPDVVDSIIEVLDASTGESLVRRRIEGMAIRFLGDRRLAVRDVGPLDVSVIHVLRIAVEEREGLSGA